MVAEYSVEASDVKLGTVDSTTAVLLMTDNNYDFLAYSYAWLLDVTRH
jgi:hypothetical protein